MTYQQAINYLDYELKTGYNGSSYGEDALITAIKALNKQVAHKVENNSCPICGVKPNSLYNYCPICGQALDWSDYFD